MVVFCRRMATIVARMVAMYVPGPGAVVSEVSTTITVGRGRKAMAATQSRFALMSAGVVATTSM